MHKPLSELGWGDHRAALYWLGILYRRPQLLTAGLSALSAGQTITTGIKLYAHCIPYLILLNAVLLGYTQSPESLGLLIVGIAVGIAGGIAVGILKGMIEGIAEGIAAGIVAGIVAGIAFGIAGGSSEGIAFEIAGEIAAGIIFGIAGGIAGGIAVGIAVGISIGMAYGITAGITYGIAVGITLLFFILRAYYTPFSLFFVWPNIMSRWYPYHPVAWDDLCALPFPKLDQLLVGYAEYAPSLGHAEIERLINHYPSQRMAALRARVILLARATQQTQSLAELSDFASRLPEGDDRFLKHMTNLRVDMQEIAQFQTRLDQTRQQILQEPNAHLLCKSIEAFQHKIAGYPEPLAREFRTAAHTWLTQARRQLEHAETLLKRQSNPQVFRAGDPVDRDNEAFIPRSAVIQELEQQIMLSTGCPGVVFYGRLRTGKTSLLKNLTGFLPPYVVTIYVSMQNPEVFSSLRHFVTAIPHAIQAQLPELAPPPADSDDLAGLHQYLTRCNTYLKTQQQRLLIAIDEYEVIDLKIGESVFPEDLLASLRESIQMHRSITWLLAGSHAIDELQHAPWTSYLISTRTVEMPFFSLAETRTLLTDPLQHSTLFQDPSLHTPRPTFTEAFWGPQGIQRIQQQTVGWPHLVQLLAETLLELCNQESAKQVDDALFARALDKAIIKGHNLFDYLLHHDASNSANEWAYLSAFRHHDWQAPPEDQDIYQSLRRRQLVSEEKGQWRLHTPLMAHWLKQRG